MPNQKISSDTLDRRDFLRLTASGLASVHMGSAFGMSTSYPVKAVAFDALAIFDPRPVFEMAVAMFPERGPELCNEWRTRQFEYTWLRTVLGKYSDFFNVTSGALTYAANRTKIALSETARVRLMQAYLCLKPWPDVAVALSRLKELGIRTAILSNFSSEMLAACTKASALSDAFEFLLSTDSVRSYKPSPIAYQMGISAFRLKKKEILFVAFAGWDAAGAEMFGYPTYWANRSNLPAEELGSPSYPIERDLHALPDFIQKHSG